MSGTDEPERPALVVAIEGEMTIFRAAELKQLLLEPFDLRGPIEVDLSGVTEIDTAGLQLLLLARHTAEARGRRLRLTGRSEPVAAVLALLRIARLFEGAPDRGAAP